MSDEIQRTRNYYGIRVRELEAEVQALKSVACKGCLETVSVYKQTAAERDRLRVELAAALEDRHLLKRFVIGFVEYFRAIERGEEGEKRARLLPFETAILGRAIQALAKIRARRETGGAGMSVEGMEELVGIIQTQGDRIAVLEAERDAAEVKLDERIQWAAVKANADKACEENTRLREALAPFAVLGCSDGNCEFRDRRGGQHTNGGCGCLGRSQLTRREKLGELIEGARVALGGYMTTTFGAVDIRRGLGIDGRAGR